MAKTLIVSYTPRKGSLTKVLVDEFLRLAEGRTEINHLDLVVNPPDLLLKENLNLVMEWTHGKRDFSEEELSILANHQELVEQVLNVDHLVLAFPIYNFTMPATVKAWIDAIVVSDKTFAFSPETGFSGLCKDKKALSIIVSGFDYGNSGEVREYASSTLRQNFDFMGMGSKQVAAFGVDQNREQLPAILDKAKAEIRDLLDQWMFD